MTETELSARLVLLSLLPDGSDELDAARRALVLKLLPAQPQRALELACGWWGEKRQKASRVTSARDALARILGLRNFYDARSAQLWCDAMLADEATDNTWFVPVLARLYQRDWPVEALLDRLEREPSVPLLNALLPLCLTPELDESLCARLIVLALPQAKVYTDVLGEEALRSPLAYSRVFLERVRAVGGERESRRALVRGVRAARLILRLRLRKDWGGKRRAQVVAWLERQPQSAFREALRRELGYITG